MRSCGVCLMDEAEGILFESTVSNFLATDADQGQVRVRVRVRRTKKQTRKL